MSDRALIPIPHKLYADCNSATKFRAALSGVRIEPGPNGTKRLTAFDDGVSIILDLEPEIATHIANLLMHANKAKSEPERAAS